MYPVIPTKFEQNTFEWEWYDKVYLFTPDGTCEMPDHHCKQTWVVSLPFITQTRNAIDIGCRDGEYSRYFLKDFNHIFCFDYRRRKLFHKNVDLNKITHFQCALGEEFKIIKASGGGSITSGSIPVEKWYDLQLYTLDQFNIPDVDYIKIDVDGFETRVLEGAKNTINTYKSLLILEQEGNDTSAIEFCEQVFNYEVAGWDPLHRNVIMKVKQ